MYSPGLNIQVVQGHKLAQVTIHMLQYLTIIIVYFDDVMMTHFIDESTREEVWLGLSLLVYH